ncbi:hypothetical protein X777_01578 [Ooceraea biroi]|uniref:Uncharacterized protein n=1 Tax=Ooceraea biroi TaxID=2015173 RepID=A0A026WSY9_OOCBI|nr:hypothetical protein X777_01578 [Ooceraea biroi]
METEAVRDGPADRPSSSVPSGATLSLRRVASPIDAGIRTTLAIGTAALHARKLLGQIKTEFEGEAGKSPNAKREIIVENVDDNLQDDGNDPVAGGSAATAAAAAPRDDDGDGDGDADDDGGGSRWKPRQRRREGPAGAAAADDEDDAISSPGHPPVLRLSARVPPRQCSRLHPLQPKVGNRSMISGSSINSLYSDLSRLVPRVARFNRDNDL